MMVVLSARAHASFHLMQIQKVIAGVNGDTAAQAIQLRMRSFGQRFVGSSRLVAWDATGDNPIVIIDFDASVTNGAAGANVLVTTTAFDSQTVPVAEPDFRMTQRIPDAYLAAGSLTFESDSGTIYWRISWGGAAYTGSMLGVATNDLDANFGPPYPDALPTSGLTALEFQGVATDFSTANDIDYALSKGPAGFRSNAAADFTVTGLPIEGDLDADGDVDLDDFSWLAACVTGPGELLIPLGCPDVAFPRADAGSDGDVDLADVAAFFTHFGA